MVDIRKLFRNRAPALGAHIRRAARIALGNPAEPVLGPVKLGLISKHLPEQIGSGVQSLAVAAAGDHLRLLGSGLQHGLHLELLGGHELELGSEPL